MKQSAKEVEHKNEGFSAPLTLLFAFGFNYVEQHLVDCQSKAKKREEETERRRERAFQLITSERSL